MPDDVSPLSMSEAVRAYTQSDRSGNPTEDNPPDRDDVGPEEPQEEDGDEDLVQGLAEEDEDTSEGDDAEGPPEEEPEDEEPESAKGRFLPDDGKVRLADGTVTTLAELKKTPLLQSDYSRKTAELAEERKAVEQTKAQFSAVEQSLAQERETLALVIRSQLPTPPDPSMLEQGSGNYDPFRFQAENYAYERKVNEIKQMIGQHQQMLQRQAQQAEFDRRQTREKERASLHQAMPHLKDPDTYNKFWADMVNYGTEVGFTAEELDEVDDHRTYVVLADAVAYRKLKAKVKEARTKVNGKPPLLQGSTRRSTEVVRMQDHKAAMARLNKTGSLKDGIQALLAREKVR